MSKKAYRLIKEGDRYRVPAGYVRGQDYNEVSTMDRRLAKDVVKARKSVSLKRKYPQILGQTSDQAKERLLKFKHDLRRSESKKEIPTFLQAGSIAIRLQQVTDNKQVAESNEAYYKKSGLYTIILKTKDGRYALYIEDR
jgi:hypothetical protein